MRMLLFGGLAGGLSLLAAGTAEAGVVYATGVVHNTTLAPYTLATANSWAGPNQGQRKNGTDVLPVRSNPFQALREPGPPTTAINFVSLGFGGSITLTFLPHLFRGPSTVVFERTNGAEEYPEELARVFISTTGVNWLNIGTVSSRSPGGQSTLSVPAGSWTYMRITDISNPANFEATADGFDVNAVSVYPVPLPAAAWAGLALMGTMGGASFLRKRRLSV